jgi:hypothetical protein
MKISLTLVLSSLSVFTVAKAGFALERRGPHHCGPHHNYPSKYAAASCSTTPTGKPNVYPNQGTTTHSVTHSNSAPYTSSATRAVTGTSSGGWEQKPSGKASFTTYTGCQEACESSLHPFSRLLGVHAERHVILQLAAGE